MNFFRKSKPVPPIPDPENIFTMPSEEEPHEGTWLQWPHNHGNNRYDRNRKRLERYEESWILMTQALHTGERVHIVVYDEAADIDRVRGILTKRGLDMGQIDFRAWPTNDVWMRDNGPVFVFDQSNQLCITDWEFNGWGNKADWEKCNQIPKKVAEELGVPVTSIPMVNEGGSVEIDGKGTLMAKGSSILNANRNKGWKKDDAEAYFRRYLGVTNFIWLDGEKGGDITDDHIDGTARFANGDSIVTFERSDFTDPREYDALARAKNAQGEPYKMVHLPVTKTKKIKGEPGIYTNYYIGNKVVVLPIFGDPSDQVAERIVQELYPARKVVGIDFTEVYKDGGLAHCVTQQQPASRQ